MRCLVTVDFRANEVPKINAESSWMCLNVCHSMPSPASQKKSDAL